MGEDGCVSEIHRYPNRPRGFEEPLFHGRASKLAVMEHFLEAPWLRRASELPVRGGTGTLARAAQEPPTGESCHVLTKPDGSAYLVLVEPARSGCRRRRRRTRTRKRRVRSVIERWREVRGWWEPGGGTYRLCFRVLLGGPGTGAVADLALDRRLGWSLTRVWD